jgi:hypothetical protein
VAKKNQPARKDREVIGLIGVGLDSADGHKRITRSENCFLIGGSEDTHERMQNTAIRFEEALRKKGKPLRETEVDEVVDIIRESME